MSAGSCNQFNTGNNSNLQMHTISRSLYKTFHGISKLLEVYRQFDSNLKTRKYQMSIGTDYLLIIFKLTEKLN